MIRLMEVFDANDILRVLRITGAMNGKSQRSDKIQCGDIGLRNISLTFPSRKLR